MKREFLKGLELSDDQIEKIMAEHGKTVADNLSKIAQKDKEAELINAQLAEANKTIKSYKDIVIHNAPFLLSYRALRRYIRPMKNKRKKFSTFLKNTTK